MNQHKTPPFGSRVLTAVTATLLAFSTSQVVADKPALSASAKYNKKSGVVTIKGKTAKTLPAQSTVSIFDATTANPLYILKTGPKGTFSYSVPRTTPPCTVRVSAGGSEIAIRVAGTGEACRKAPTCSITGPSVTSYTGKADISFAATAKAKKGSSLSYAWSLSDGATSDQASFDHSFANPGNYRADVTVADAATGLSCSDSITVSVAPDLTNAGLPANAVPQADAPSSDPASPEGRKGDKDSFVVLPYDDMGMQGAGSSVNLPYNPYLGYNSLNAQVLKKVEHKPVVLDGAAVSVFYSAGSNPNDPAGAGSVNSTSQNWFADTKEPGSNWDPATSISSPLDAKGNSTNTVERPVDIKFIDGHNYNSDKAVVRKTEMWDHIRSPIDEAIDPTAPRAGISNIDPQNRYIPAEPRRLTHPDEGVVGSSDSAAGRRAMPGIDGPYAKNDPQQISAYNTQSKTFVAQFLPATPVDDKGRINPYPLMRVEAKEGNAVVAKTDAVFSAADEVGCKQCHSKGGIGSDDSIWRTPVTEAELTTADGKPGPATGAGSFPDGANPAAPWPGAIHN
ncbi:MAG: PKD domain-containing protein, partial [Methylococcaceae bacterium]|nr:PKD domain-containing protein [Methylococcaceae bacterium]